MSVTLASDAVFKSFLGENKVDALLHGHSYTAHAVGCGVANKTLEILEKMEKGQDWKESKKRMVNFKRNFFPHFIFFLRLDFSITSLDSRTHLVTLVPLFRSFPLVSP